MLNRCLELGLELALDDFGTGYSSITYLRDFPVKTIKIDRSFIMGISHSEQDFNLVSHIIHMANDMGKHVIAEGIESIEQGELLLGMGCELGQGYVIAKPMPASHVLAWVKDWQSYPTWLKTSKGVILINNPSAINSSKTLEFCLKNGVKTHEFCLKKSLAP